MDFMNELATKYNLENNHGQAWGFIDGYWFQLEPPAYGKGYLRIRTAVHMPQGDAASEMMDALGEIVNAGPITCDRENGTITLNWSMSIIGAKASVVESVLMRLIELFKKAGAAPACFHCNSERTDSFALVNGTAVRLCSQCQAEIASTIRKETEAYAESGNNYLRGIVGAVVGALIGSVAWVVIGILGYLAAIGGIAISFCAVKGYQLMKGKITKPAIIAICLICLVVMVLAQFITFDIQVYNEFKNAGEDVLFKDVFALTFQLPFMDSEITAGFLKDCGLGLLFMAIGSYSIIKPLFAKAAAPAGKFERL